ncbi:hypothetical protein PR202_ga31131 [Eleusine coracana subsp. coracana]|uniref:Uncharacterized protein n=1 Tax=Eleusine coracana subsp. coracana TaxID=191504 RepID=A0AAV5DR38_ELECO|nr:hypothetical protein PR202_ga31131 [Eleusine coracana subsp. coracana]
MPLDIFSGQNRFFLLSSISSQLPPVTLFSSATDGAAPALLSCHHRPCSLSKLSVSSLLSSSTIAIAAAPSFRRRRPYFPPSPDAPLQFHDQPSHDQPNHDESRRAQVDDPPSHDEFLPNPLIAGSDGAGSPETGAGWLDADLLRRVSGAADADQALDIVAELAAAAGVGAALNAPECNAIITAAFDRGNVDLALSVFEVMRSDFTGVGGFRWARPDVRTYALLVQRLAAALRVSDAIRIIDYVSRAGVSSTEEVPFGMIVRCPTCMIAVAVAQPQDGTQIRTPCGTARTHRFATQTVELPAQEGERVTISLAAPSNVYREMGPVKISARARGFRPGEPMCLTNHINGQVSKLLRAPSKNEGQFLLSPYLLAGGLALLASGDAASAFIDPTLPRLITATVIASAAVGTTLNQLPQKAVDIVAIRQQLLSQYDVLQTRLKDLKQLAENELCSMIEIEVEMDYNVIAAEAASSAGLHKMIKLDTGEVMDRTGRGHKSLE